MSAAEFHQEPVPHLVFDVETWSNLKANLSSASARDTFDVAGQIGLMAGVPVYIDRCPWHEPADGNARSPE